MNEGPLQISDFLMLFVSINDPGYARPFIEAGDGKGLEAHGQAWAQFAAVSESTDSLFGSMYFLPFSGQTSPSASGGAQAQVTLTFERSATGNFKQTITIPAGTPISEIATDFGPSGGEPAITGRRYLLLEDVTFLPGETGPFDMFATAEQIGPGYNNALPGSITGLEQVGVGFQNDGASIVPGFANHALVLDPNPDVISQQMIGASVLLFAGANVGQIRRIVGYRDPQPFASPPNGGTALLAATGIYSLATVAGTFQIGELIVQLATNATARVVDVSDGFLVADRISAPDLTPGSVVIGQQSGAVLVISNVDQAPSLTAESMTAGWRVVGWASDFGITCTNAAQPTGGLAAMLDELAGENGMARMQGEGDDDFAFRASTPLDLITPPAVLRAANRVLGPFGGAASLHEVGQGDFRGFFYDGDPSSNDPAIAFAYDIDLTLRPQDRFKTYVDYLEMRAFFIIGVPQSDLGDFGFAYDVGSHNAYDCAPFLAFYDGFALTTASVRQAIWQEVYRTRAGGVGFTLREDPG